MNKTNAGVWLDHREAVVVVLSEAGEKTTCILSNVEKQLRRSGKPPDGAFEAQLVPADDSREREYTGHLASYYDKIVSSLSEADAVLILGPGEAKGELKKHFNGRLCDTQQIALETADRMTEPQLAALVRHHFHHDPARKS
jgi:stalled ribosome rescue protein Dom34